ncbi:hypothetical protein NMG60_11034822 [Bertholletia excelsa]
MLRNRSRAVTTKQALMAEQSSLSSPVRNSMSSLFGSPRLFNGFLPMGPPETETVSPTSILDFKLPFCRPRNQTELSKNFSGNKHSWEKLEPRGIGLALFDDQNTTNLTSQTNRRMVLFGSKLKIQIPQPPTSVFPPSESPKSPADFGIKTRKLQFGNSLSPFASANSEAAQAKDSPPSVSGFISPSEMELSEDYTRVISHGPNPRTTHIYDDCIVETCCGVVGLTELKNVYSPPSQSFLSSCHTCKKSLEQSQDIFMYRGEKSFCSRECRCQEMLFDGVENPEPDGAL